MANPIPNAKPLVGGLVSHGHLDLETPDGYGATGTFLDRGGATFNVRHPSYASLVVNGDWSAAIKAALADAAAQGGGVVLIPAGQYRIRARTERLNAITVPPGVELRGVGTATEILLDTTYEKDDPGAVGTARWRYYGIIYDSRSAVRSLRINGQRDQVDRDAYDQTDDNGVKSLQVYALVGAIDAEDALVEDVQVHDVVGINKESFGVMTGSGTKRIRWREVHSWNVDGTPLHISSSEDVEAVSISGRDSSWMGVSIFRSKHVIIRGVTTTGNERHGLNVEWSDPVDIFEPVCYGNGEAGIGGFGPGVCRVWGGSVFNNNTKDNTQFGELRLRPGGSADRQQATVWEFHDTRVIPNADNEVQYHLVYVRDLSVTEGPTVPRLILLNTKGTEKWNLRTRTRNADGSEGARPERTNAAGPQYGALDYAGVVHHGGLLNWTRNGAIEVGAYAGEDAEGPAPVVLTATAAFQQLRSEHVLRPGRRYHIRARVKIEDKGLVAGALPRWVIFHEHVNVDNGEAKRPDAIDMPFGWQDQGRWFEVEGVFYNDLDTATRLVIRPEDAPVGANTKLIVDYLQVREIMGAPDQSDGEVQMDDEDLLCPVHIGPLAGLSTTSSITTNEPYAGDDALSEDARTFVCTNAGGNIYTGVVLRPHRRYRVEARVRPNDTNRWTLLHRTLGGSGSVNSVTVPYRASDVGQWHVLSAVFETQDDSTLVMLLCNPVGGVLDGDSSTIDVDYVRIYRLAGSIYDSDDPESGSRSRIDGFYQDEPAASQSGVPLERFGPGVTHWIASRPGSIRAVWAKATPQRSSGSATVALFRNGVNQNVNAVLDGANPAFRRNTRAVGIVTYEAGDVLELRLTTDSAWAPNDGRIDAGIEVEE